jgi:dUTP pyrophosphatase
LDVFYSPSDPNISVIKIEPGDNKTLPTGLSFGIPHGYMLQVCNRSSMGAKRSLVVGAHIVDSGYDGEVFIDLHNIGTEAQFVEAGSKIAQLILVPVVNFRVIEAKDGELYRDAITISSRGSGSLGSTDEKKQAYVSVAELDISDKHPSHRPGTVGDWTPNGF